MVSDTEYYEGLWGYYQDFCKTHNALGITDLVVQLNNAVAKVAELEAKLEKYRNLEPVAWICDGDLYEVQQWNLFTGDGPIPNQIPLYALEMK